MRGNTRYASSDHHSHGSGLSPAYGVLLGLTLCAALGWPFVAGFAVAVGPWVGWKFARRDIS